MSKLSSPVWGQERKLWWSCQPSSLDFQALIICGFVRMSMRISSTSFIATSQCVLDVSARHCRACKHVSLIWRQRGHISWVHYCLLLKTLPTGANPVNNFDCHFAFPHDHFFIAWWIVNQDIYFVLVRVGKVVYCPTNTELIPFCRMYDHTVPVYLNKPPLYHCTK